MLRRTDSSICTTLAMLSIVWLWTGFAAADQPRTQETVVATTAEVSWCDPPNRIGLVDGSTVVLAKVSRNGADIRPGELVTVIGKSSFKTPGLVLDASVRRIARRSKSDNKTVGEITALHSDGFSMDSGDALFRVIVSDETELDGFDSLAELQIGDRVEVEGEPQGYSIQAEKVKLLEPEDEGGVDFESEGRVESLTADGTFTLDDTRTYRVTTTTEYHGGIDEFEDLETGQILEVHARRLPSGANVADEVELKGSDEEDDDEIEGLIAAIESNAIVISGAGRVFVTASTRYDGDADRFDDLRIGWSVQADVFTDQGGNWVATQIRAEDEEGATIDGEDYEPRQALVLPLRGADLSALANRHDAAIIGEVGGLAVLFEWQDELDNGLLAALAADPDVRSVQPNYRFRDPESVRRRFPVVDRSANPTTVEEQAATLAVHLGSALQRVTGTDTVIALLDTGVDPDHPFLQGVVMSGGLDLVDGDLEPWESRDGIDQDGDGDIDESAGHGTFVASLLTLAAPDARILPYRVLDDDGGGSAYHLAMALVDAIARSVDVINLSLVYHSRSDTVDLLLEEASAAGIVVVCSAGNDSETTLPFPAADRHVLAVTAVAADGLGPADFANLGASVALAAPGEAIYGAMLDGQYGVWSGTSMAAPFIAATAALLRELDPTLDPEIIRLSLEQSGYRVAAGAWTGSALNMAAALDLVEPAQETYVSRPVFFR